MADALRDALQEIAGMTYDKWTNGYRAGEIARDALAATQPQRAALAAPSGYVLVPVEPTPEMIAAYLAANNAYWRLADELPPEIGKWRIGSPSEATADGYRAMLATAPARPVQAEAEPKTIGPDDPRYLKEVIRRLREQGEAMLRDAARYRALRKMSWDMGPLCVVRDPSPDRIRPGTHCPSFDMLDADLDAAIAAQGTEGGA